MRKKDTRLYNVIMPIWMLVIFPLTWFVVLPLNYLIDTLVLRLTMKYLNIEKRKEIYKMTIIKTWVLGFLADFIGAAILLIPVLSADRLSTNSNLGFIADKMCSIMLNPFDNIYSFIITVIAVIVSAYFVYLFNYKFALKKAFENGYIDINEKKKIALSMAIFTAPYVFLLPAFY